MPDPEATFDTVAATLKALRDRLTQSDADLSSLLQSNDHLAAAHDESQKELARITGERDETQAALKQRDADVQRLTVQLQHARDVASEALVGKAKDQLAIEGKDAQLAELRSRSSADSDARLAAEMELVGAVTARDNLAAEVKDLRAQVEALHSARRAP
jgi:chromosome segregation ATPase